jgi:hypothetical protein
MPHEHPTLRESNKYQLIDQLNFVPNFLKKKKGPGTGLPARYENTQQVDLNAC